MNTAWEKATQIVRRLGEAGHVAYIAGGAVRDRLLGLPFHDADVATDADSETVRRLFPKSRLVGKSFGVVRVTGDGPPVEVATFRQDGPYSDGRRPDWVRPASAEEDAHRRDFTLNGMFVDPIRDCLLDWVGGREDLRARRVRAIGEPLDRFREDSLRLFRAVRFAARLGFTIEQGTWRALCAEAPKSRRLAAERVRDELTRIVTGPNPGRGLSLLQESGLLRAWLPEVAALEGVSQPESYHPEGDALAHTRLTLDALENPSPTLAWAALLHDVGKPETSRLRDGRITFHGHAERGAEMAGTICRRLKLSKDQTEQIQVLVIHHMRFLNYPHMTTATRRRFLARPHIEEHFALHRADCLASNGDLSLFTQAMADWSRAEGELPPPLLTGHDLRQAGYRPGPLFAVILDAVRDRQLAGELNDTPQALAFVTAHWKPPSSGD